MSEEKGVVVRRATTQIDIASCLALRSLVFIEEQGVPPDLERDGLDDVCEHYIAESACRVIGTARLRLVPPMAKVQRVAVLAEHRGRGIGAALMRAMEARLVDPARHDDAELSPITTITLGAQRMAAAFYERLGYEQVGGPFMDAGIEHVRMDRHLDPRSGAVPDV